MPARVLLPLVTAALLLAPASGLVSAQAPAADKPAAPAEAVGHAPRLVYGGDAAFPPLEYLSANGQPRGFNVELLRLLAEETGARVEFRLGRWSDVMGAFERGQVDLMSLARSDWRAERYDFLMQTWTLHRGLLMQAGRTAYPRALDDLRGEVVACEERGQIHEALLRLPLAVRPTIRTVVNQREACRLLQQGEVTAAAGNSLTLRYFASQIGLASRVEVEMEPFPYYLVTAKGRGAEMAFLSEAFERVHFTNRFHALVERALVLPESPQTWIAYWRYFALLAGLLVVLGGGSYAWNHALQDKVLRRTRDLMGSLKEKERLGAALMESEARFRGMVDSLRVGVLQHSTEGRVLFANPAALAALGLTSAELMQLGWEGAVAGAIREDGSTLPPEEEPVRLALSDGRAVRDTVIGIARPARARVWLSLSVEPELGPGGRVRGLLTTFEDVSERKRSQEQIRFLAYHDSMTGLPNRELFLDRLTMAIAHALRHRTSLAVAFIDLDQFKIINDSLGHTVGDQVLQAVAQRVRSCLRDEDTVARLGGDEFTALLGGVRDASHAARVAEKLLASIKQPLPIEGRDLRLSASIGVGMFPSDGEDAETLLRNADTAMYRAKDMGRDQCQFYTASMSRRVMLHFDMEARLRRAIQGGELRLHYQPVVALGDGRIEGVEALIRWTDPERGAIPPDDFIPLAEVTGLIGEISEFVVRTGCGEHTAIARACGAPPLLAINLSARQFHRGEVVDQVKAVLEETRLEPGLLELEITETAAMQDQPRAVELLRRLREIGVRLSIDDFGTGYSSLSYLRRFPIDTLKVDRSFVRDIASDRSAAAIIAAIVSVAHELGLRVVAEGVETEAQLEVLRRQRCDAAQGYLFGRAVPLAELPESFASIRGRWSEFGVRAAGAGVRS